MGKLNSSHRLIMRMLKTLVTSILFKEEICAALHLLTLQNTSKEKGAIPSKKKSFVAHS